MSAERSRTTNPSLWAEDEGCQLPLSNSFQAVERGGVSVDGMSGKDVGLNQEISVRDSKEQPSAQALSKADRAHGEVGVSHSSVDRQQSKSCQKRRGGTYVNALQSDEGEGDGWDKLISEWNRIVTPEKIRKLQRTLYRKAKAEPKYRFYSLYGEMCRRDVLEEALRLVSRNDGCAGVDGEELEQINSEGRRESWLEELEAALRTRSYRPNAVLREYVPKGDGKMRPLGIPTVKDRVAQAAAMIVLLPIFEADLHERSYAYRPGRNAQQAIMSIISGIAGGRHEVIDADLSGYFDSIPHQRLMKLVARRISDGTMLKMIRAWLRAPIEERDAQGKPTRKRNNKGTPQGGVISPLLANLYLNKLDHEVNDRCEQRPVMVRYADDFVILCRQGQGKELMTRLEKWLERRGLTLNREKTRLVDSRKEGFKFLGYSVSQRRRWYGSRYVHVEPHAKSRQKLRNAVKLALNRRTLKNSEEETIQRLNRLLKGWAGYFRFRNYTRVFKRTQFYVRMKVGRWLWKRHAKKQRVAYATLAQTHGLYRLL